MRPSPQRPSKLKRKPCNALDGFVSRLIPVSDENLPPRTTVPKHVTGVRSILSGDCLPDPLKEEILTEARAELPIVVKAAFQRKFHFIVAPALHDYRAKCHGRRYRDYNGAGGRGQFTCMFFCDNHSGSRCIRFWKNSSMILRGERIYKDRNVSKALARSETLDMQPTKNHVFFFDARLMHQSLLHTKDNDRVALAVRFSANDAPLPQDETETDD